jgi:hypothetical protein
MLSLALTGLLPLFNPSGQQRLNWLSYALSESCAPAFNEIGKNYQANEPTHLSDFA